MLRTSNREHKEPVLPIEMAYKSIIDFSKMVKEFQNQC